MEIILKKTGEDDFFTTENLTRKAFWNLFKPGCDEHLLLHRLRKSKSYVNSLDLIAVYNNRITGHIIATKARVSDDAKNEPEVLCAGKQYIEPIVCNYNTAYAYERSPKLLHSRLSKRFIQ